MRLVINASIVVKWLLPDEPLVPEVRRLLQEFQKGQWREFIVPEFCMREVANALWSLVSGGESLKKKSEQVGRLSPR